MFDSAVHMFIKQGNKPASNPIVACGASHENIYSTELEQSVTCADCHVKMQFAKQRIELRMAIARGWGHDASNDKEIDADLVEAITIEVEKFLQPPVFYYEAGNRKSMEEIKRALMESQKNLGGLMLMPRPRNRNLNMTPFTEAPTNALGGMWSEMAAPIDINLLIKELGLSHVEKADHLSVTGTLESDAPIQAGIRLTNIESVKNEVVKGDVHTVTVKGTLDHELDSCVAPNSGDVSERLEIGCPQMFKIPANIVEKQPPTSTLTWRSGHVKDPDVVATLRKLKDQIISDTNENPSSDEFIVCSSPISGFMSIDFGVTPPTSSLSEITTCETCEGLGQCMTMVCYGGMPTERMGECPDCDGKGVFSNSFKVPISTPSGSGVSVDYPMPGDCTGNSDSQNLVTGYQRKDSKKTRTCGACQGTKLWKPGEPCPVCEGTGVLPSNA